MRAIAVKLHTDRATEPARGLELVHDEGDAVAPLAHGEDAQVLRAGDEAAHDLLARRVEQDEIVTIDMNRDAAGRRPLLGALRLVPQAGIARDVEQAFRRRQPQ